ncbi:raffinose/stachyose/melibiose transport system permease protein [Halobacillus karajensis]|uniref:Sn-glycerol-3-phosphate transport system permease protein UgpA n=1 Tax=Halobacillus karajensis TaxID=195088 RepID=A0A024P3S2_9BACI|nr:sugar ABC transporter permease [Halobacillus karajensis]CDQ18864.1 sn-glycerol-3-phosphate transport system permease protein UgpA [Halobacillus karajensis]CDQ23063.1 sn-glycerol-3-phosphate transport system permease protein UgpA [Halobacillus karajensis]CDQ26545.1 sn-glycerol-3-phosphate transport system permease protein UgpA [Halobacillus karajensis]SEH45066.1 raffinose/stachyose/melibiose transport system permease protein [Halobacillus karajensis]
MQNRSLSFWLFLTPVILGLGIVVVIPFLYGLFYSFTDWNGITANAFIGFENYIKLFQESEFMNSIWFTVKFAVVTVILLNIMGLGLALLVTRNIKSSNLLRTVFFMPNLIGGLILGFIWQFIFISVFGDIAGLTGIEGLNGWLSTTNTGFWGLVILTAWQMAGYIMIIYIAYLENIPKELIEAAKIDGASSFQRFKNITFPLVAPAFTVSMFLTLSMAFKIYDQNLSLTNGGPFNSTQMVAMEIVRTAFSDNQMAYAQAKAVIFFLIVAVIALTQVYYNKKREVEM